MRSPEFTRPTACWARWCSAAGAVQGSLVEVSMLEAMAHFALEPFAAFFALGTTPDLERSPAARAGLHSAHGGPAAHRHSPLLAREILGRTRELRSKHRSWRSDARFRTRQARIANYESLNAELDRAILAARPGALGRTTGTPRRSVRADQHHRRSRSTIRKSSIWGSSFRSAGAHGGTRSVRPPVQFGGVRSSSVRAAPLLNEHGQSIREALARGERWPAVASNGPVGA